MGRISQILRIILPALAAFSGIVIISIFRDGHYDKTTLLVTLPLSYLVFEAVQRAARRYRFAVFLQSLAAAPILAYFISELGHFAVLIWAPAAAALCSGCLSLLIRELNEAEQTAVSMNYQLALKNQDLQTTRVALLKQDEAERRLLASDLHDQVLADLRALAEKIRQDTDSIRKADLEKLTSRATSAIREVMENLSPSVLENLGLKAALDELIRKGVARGDYHGRFIDKCDEAILQKVSASEQLLLFRIAQEALNNVGKHSQATKVIISLASQTGIIELRIRDDGVGLGALSSQAKSESRGLRYMKLKADLIGANLTIGKSEEKTEEKFADADPAQARPGTEVIVIFNVKEPG